MAGIGNFKPIIKVLTSKIQSSKLNNPAVSQVIKPTSFASDVFVKNTTQITIDEVRKLFPTGKLDENNYIVNDIKTLLKNIKTERKLIDLTPELSDTDYSIIADLMNMHRGMYIPIWKSKSTVDNIPNIQKLALFTRTMRLTKQTKEFIEFDMNKWDIVVDGIIRKPREAIMPLLEYKANSNKINEALTVLSKMTPEIQNKIDIITKYLDAYVVKKEFTVYRGDKSFDILPKVNINGYELDLAKYIDTATSEMYQSFLKGENINNQILLVRKYIQGRHVPQARFMSTAMTESAVKDYAKKIKWNITVPIGTKGTSIESFNVERLNEAEFLGQRNGQFKITDATYKPEENLWYFDAIIEQKH